MIMMSTMLVTLLLFTILRYVLWRETNTGWKQFPEKGKDFAETCCHAGMLGISGEWVSKAFRKVVIWRRSGGRVPFWKCIHSPQCAPPNVRHAEEYTINLLLWAVRAEAVITRQYVTLYDSVTHYIQDVFAAMHLVWIPMHCIGDVVQCTVYSVQCTLTVQGLQCTVNIQRRWKPRPLLFLTWVATRISFTTRQKDKKPNK